MINTTSESLKEIKVVIFQYFSFYEHLKIHNLGLQTLMIGPEVIKLFSCSTQLSTKFIRLINVKLLAF